VDKSVDMAKVLIAKKATTRLEEVIFISTLFFPVISQHNKIIILLV